MDIKLFSKLAKDIYSLTVDQESFRRLLQDLVTAYQCRSVGFHIIDKNNLHVVSEAVPETSDKDLQIYANHFSSLTPYLSKLRDIEKKTHAGEVYLFNGSKLVRLEAAHNLIEAMKDDSASMLSLLFREGSYFIQFVIQSDADKEPDYTLLLKSVTLLLPHIHKAFKIYHDLEKYKNYSAGLEQAMDQLSSGAILFNGEGTPVYQSRKARDIIASTHGFSLISDRVFGPTAEKTTQLRKLIKDSIHHGKNESKQIGVMTIDSSNPEDRNIALISVPLHPSIRALVDEDAAVFAVLMLGVFDATTGLEPEVLHLLYGLTHSESRLAASISNGRSLEEYCEKADISMNTARSYLKLIFQKTDTSRQGELVALLKSIPTIADHGVANH